MAVGQHYHPRIMRWERTVIVAVLGLVLAVAASMGCSSRSKPIAHQHLPDHTYTVRDPQFLRSMTGLFDSPAIGGNAVQTLVNGHEVYPVMLEAIRAAEKSITFETFLYWSGDIGQEFAEAISERSRAGVKCHIIIDAIGSDKFAPEHHQMMEDAGVHIVRYHPVERLLMLFTADEFNHRTHRKLLVIDGKVGFTGGLGVADFWLGNAQGPEHWRDTHYRVEGPVVAHMQGAFIDNWVSVVGEVLDGPDYFPPLEPAGPMHGQMFMSSPEGGSASMELMFLLSIIAASESVYIATPYFVPDDLMIQAMRQARNRGVSIKIVLPGAQIDVPVVRHASRAIWSELLESGIEIYEYQPTMYHCKLLVVDRLWTSVGSTNVDPRSFRLNAEANLNIYDADFAALQIEIIERDIALSKRITVVSHEDRPFFSRIAEFFASLIKPLL